MTGRQTSSMTLDVSPTAEAAPPYSGTERWPKECLSKGDWYQVPKVLLKRFPALGIEPQHLLLILVLQTDRYRDRPHRFYWEELADLCGCKKNTVRRWGYELKRKGLLDIVQMRKVLPGEERHVGRRNERSIFDLAPLEAKLSEMQRDWNEQRRAKGRRKSKSSAA